MKVWITKYALTRGIIETDNLNDCYSGKGYSWIHYDKEAAIQKSEEMRQKKIASLKKQIEKLEEMRFE